MTIQEKTSEYLTWIRQSASSEEREKRRQDFHAWYAELSKEEQVIAEEILLPYKKEIVQKLNLLEEQVKEAGIRRRTFPKAVS